MVLQLNAELVRHIGQVRRLELEMAARNAHRENSNLSSAIRLFVLEKAQVTKTDATGTNG